MAPTRIAAVLLLTAALLGPAPAVADAGHVTALDPVSYDDPTALLAVYAAQAGADDPDPTATAGCGPAAADPVPDGQPIIVSMSPAAPFTVGAIPPGSWRN